MCSLKAEIIIISIFPQTLANNKSIKVFAEILLVFKAFMVAFFFFGDNGG
jgi:hypothetical protein